MDKVEYLNYVDSMITSDATSTREITSRIAMEKATFEKKKKKALFTSEI
jgi:hypothetical protein